jgi:hypothetical protein
MCANPCGRGVAARSLRKMLYISLKVTRSPRRVGVGGKNGSQTPLKGVPFLVKRLPTPTLRHIARHKHRRVSDTSSPLASIRMKCVPFSNTQRLYSGFRACLPRTSIPTNNSIVLLG